MNEVDSQQQGTYTTVTEHHKINRFQKWQDFEM